MSDSVLEYQILEKLEFNSPFNCILQKYNNESRVYFAPERNENLNLTTYLTDCFSVGVCLVFLDNYLVVSEEELAEKLTSVRQPYADIFADNKFAINTQTDIYSIANQLLSYEMKQRKSLKDLDTNCMQYSSSETSQISTRTC